MLVIAVGAMGANIGDTYQQIFKEKGNPRSEINAGSMRVLSYADATIKLKDDVVVSIKAVAAESKKDTAALSGPAKPLSADAQIAVLKGQLDDAVTRVRRVVNQSVTPLPKDPTLKFRGQFYFHDGATRPDFNTVDVRATQEKVYDSEGYILWQGAPPDVMWDGRELEFNAMTKYFYIDRTVPKKKLTESEMLDINRLYRIIGRCEAQLLSLGYRGTLP